MDHLRTSNLLSSYAAGELDSRDAGAVANHADTCDECQSWLDTYALLVEALVENGSAGRSAHCASEELAGFALAQAAQDRVTRARVSRHLSECRECSEDVELARLSVEPGDPSASAASGPERLAKPSAGGRRALQLFAASVLILIGIVAIARLASTVPSNQRVYDLTVQGDHSVNASTSILVETTEVKTGGALRLSAGDVVVLGNGFSVATGASLTVTAANSNEEDDSA